MSESPSNQPPVLMNGGVSAPTAGQKRASPLTPSGIPQAATKPTSGVASNKDKEVTCFLPFFLSFLLLLAHPGAHFHTRAVPADEGAQYGRSPLHGHVPLHPNCCESLSMALCCRRHVLRLLLRCMTCNMTQSLHWCRSPMLNSMLNHFHV